MSASRLVWLLPLVACGAPASVDPDVVADGTAPDAASIDAWIPTHGSQITLRTALRGRYVTAEDGGNGAVSANRPSVGAWERWTLAEVTHMQLTDGDAIHLAAANGRFITAENGGGGEVNATRPTASTWETFIVNKVAGSAGASIHAGDTITLRTADLHYLSAAQGGGSGLDASAIDPLPWAQFQLGNADGVSETSPYSFKLDDELDGPMGAIDPAIWSFETGAGGWGNNQLQYYTDRTTNVLVDGNGSLQIIARAEDFGGAHYTSARITTANKITQAYGWFEARIRMPSGVGIWPAFWSLGSNVDAGWPGRGEIDIMEAARDFSINHGSAHGPGYSGGGALTATFHDETLADDFHVYSVGWREGEIRWYVDGRLFEVRTPADLPSGTTWVFDHPFYVLLNVAVGGSWPGSPDGSTVFPARMDVDYVRIYQPLPP